MKCEGELFKENKHEKVIFNGKYGWFMILVSKLVEQKLQQLGLMVDRIIYSQCEYQPTYNWGAPHCI